MKVDLYVHWAVAFFDKLTRGLDEDHRDKAILGLEKLMIELGSNVRRKRAKQAWTKPTCAQFVHEELTTHLLLDLRRERI